MITLEYPIRIGVINMIKNVFPTIFLLFLIIGKINHGQAIPLKINEYRVAGISFRMEYADSEYAEGDTVVFFFNVHNSAKLPVYIFDPAIFANGKYICYNDSTIIHNKIYMGSEWEPHAGFIQQEPLQIIQPEDNHKYILRMKIQKSESPDYQSSRIGIKYYRINDLADVYFCIGFVIAERQLVNFNPSDDWNDIHENDKLWFYTKLRDFVLGPLLIKIK